MALTILYTPSKFTDNIHNLGSMDHGPERSNKNFRSTSKFFKKMYNYLFTESQRRKKSDELQFKDFSSQMMRYIIEEKGKFKEEIKRGFTPSEIYASSMLVISAGHETTASTLQFVMFMLAANPNIQQRLYKDIISKEHLKYEDIRDMKYLDAIIKGLFRRSDLRVAEK